MRSPFLRHLMFYLASDDIILLVQYICISLYILADVGLGIRGVRPVRRPLLTFRQILLLPLFLYFKLLFGCLAFFLSKKKAKLPQQDERLAQKKK